MFFFYRSWGLEQQCQLFCRSQGLFLKGLRGPNNNQSRSLQMDVRKDWIQIYSNYLNPCYPQERVKHTHHSSSRSLNLSSQHQTLNHKIQPMLHGVVLGILHGFFGVFLWDVFSWCQLSIYLYIYSTCQYQLYNKLVQSLYRYSRSLFPGRSLPMVHCHIYLQCTPTGSILTAITVSPNLV